MDEINLYEGGRCLKAILCSNIPTTPKLILIIIASECSFQMGSTFQEWRYYPLSRLMHRATKEKKAVREGLDWLVKNAYLEKQKGDNKRRESDFFKITPKVFNEYLAYLKIQKPDLAENEQGSFRTLSYTFDMSFNYDIKDSQGSFRTLSDDNYYDIKDSQGSFRTLTGIFLNPQFPNEFPNKKLNTNILPIAEVPSAPDIHIGISDKDDLKELDLIFDEVATADDIPLEVEKMPLREDLGEDDGKATPQQNKALKVAKKAKPRDSQDSARKKALGLFRLSYSRIKQDWEWERKIFVRGNTNSQMDEAFKDLWPKYPLADFQLLYDCLKERKQIGAWDWNPNTVEKHMLNTIGKPMLEPAKDPVEEVQYIDSFALFEAEIAELEAKKKAMSEKNLH